MSEQYLTVKPAVADARRRFLPSVPFPLITSNLNIRYAFWIYPDRADFTG